MYAKNLCILVLITAQFPTPFKLSCDAEKAKFALLDRQKLSKITPGFSNEFRGFESAMAAA